MKRTDYTKPTMKVVELKHRTELLIGSNKKVTAKRTCYGRADLTQEPGYNEETEEWEWN